MHLPNRLRIGWRWYDVISWDSLDAHTSRRFGECDIDTARIRVDPAYGSAKAANTLLHEVLHAIWKDKDLPAKAAEEPVVTTLADGLCALARDNPDFMQDWLNVMRSDE